MQNFDLNASQTEAVLHSGGPLLAVSGPGSGKTRVISCRVANLVENRNVQPDKILAITFTNKAAEEMRSRVAVLLGADSGKADTIWISTFHSMCAKILRKHAGKLGFRSDFHIYDQRDAYDALINVCADMNVSRKEARKAAKSSLSECASAAKNNLLSLNVACGDMCLENENGEPVLYSEILEEYAVRMKAQNAVDFDDLLFLTWQLFCEHSDVLAKYQQKFEHVLVDEYQDTNTVQNELAKMLAAPQNNICAVGDPDQSIYRFRGARVENILQMSETFPDIKIVRMGENYRSVPEIVKTASDLISYNPDIFGRCLQSQRLSSAGCETTFFAADDCAEESDFVADRIQEHIKIGGSFSDAAVFYRTHSMAESLEIAFKWRGLPYKISGGTSFFERSEIRDCVAMLRCSSENPDFIAAARTANRTMKGLGEKTLQKISQHAQRCSISLTEAFLSPSEAGITGQKRAAAEKFGEMLAEALGNSIAQHIQPYLPTPNTPNLPSTNTTA